MLKKEWTPEDFTNARKAIRIFIKSRPFASNQSGDALKNKRRYTEIDSALGLAYTSSGDYAGLFVCNVQLFLDKHKQFEIYGFCIDNNDTVYAHCLDIYNNDNDLYIRIA